MCIGFGVSGVGAGEVWEVVMHGSAGDALVVVPAGAVTHVEEKSFCIFNQGFHLKLYSRLPIGILYVVFMYF